MRHAFPYGEADMMRSRYLGADEKGALVGWFPCQQRTAELPSAESKKHMRGPNCFQMFDRLAIPE